MTLPGETEVGNAGMQPCRGIAWWAHPDDERSAGTNKILAVPQTSIGSKAPDALKIPARKAEYSLTASALSPFPAEPTRVKDAIVLKPGYTNQVRMRFGDRG
jgi:hypothetical protein